MDMDNDIKITIQLKDKANLLANAIVSLNTIAFGFVTIKNFAIWKSNHFNERLQEAINITPPSKPAYGKHYPIIFFENKDKWFELEQQIYDAFSASRAGLNTEEIDLDEVDKGITEMTEKENKNNDY
ncbi:MAG: hypothetical protein Q8O68_01430 [Candidatus Daviesbacteria bacterium]|nr:hypothetical protein [Candidatus Daviesbacteria bacterium]